MLCKHVSNAPALVPPAHCSDADGKCQFTRLEYAIKAASLLGVELHDLQRIVFQPKQSKYVDFRNVRIWSRSLTK